MKFLKNKIQEMAATYGVRYAATNILDRYVQDKYGFSLAELPDSMEIASIKDEMEFMLSNMFDEDSFNSEEIMYYLNNTFGDGFIEQIMMD